MTCIRLCILASIASLLATSCGGDDGPSVDEVCTKRAKVVCAKRNECSNGFDIARNFPNITACETWEKATCEQSVERTGSGNTVAVNVKCTAALQKQTCAERALDAPEACAFVGKLKDGTKCISTNQCASNYCDIPAGMTCGVCRKKTAAGTTCDSSGDCTEASSACGPWG
jgi:hypothetical protein